MCRTRGKAMELLILLGVMVEMAIFVIIFKIVL